ncbi:hypothetical protein [Sciscionella marina]|uniref:hypothetical protein n=1 Tax=Sciscionella marina TaxID=508770 RepID=UPI00037B16AF|nr:hypothetical protein [Sciscionella marina]
MRRRRLVVLAASAGVLAVVATGCNDRANRDLNEYSTAKPAAPGPAKASAPSSTPVSPVSEARADATLRPADVREEGVSQAAADPAPRLPDCLASDAGRTEPVAAWSYPTGSKIYQYVLTGRLAGHDCGSGLTVAAQPGLDRQQSWCTAKNCGFAGTRAGTLSVVLVEAKQRAKAAEAVQRLAPAVTARLSAG